MTTAKWADDAFLDSLRQQGDPAADATVAELIATGGTESTRWIFAQMTSDASPMPDDAPPELKAFFADTGRLPAGVDLARATRGGEVYLRHAFTGALILLAGSLPAGYSALCLTRILSISGDLKAHPYKRLMGVLQMVVNVISPHAFEPQGSAIVTAQKLRLLHAGIRNVAAKHRPDYQERFGVPVNHEDMLATIMGFSYLVIDGLRKLKVKLSDDEAETLYYPWTVFARVMGIHPPGRPDDGSLVPPTLAEAKVFYDAYARRQYVEADQNPDGVALAQDNLEMIRDMIPGVLRMLGFGAVPRIYMEDLLGAEGMRRVGLDPVALRPLTRWLGDLLPRIWQRGVDSLPEHVVEATSRLLFQHLIVKEWGGKVTFLVPDSLAQMRQLA